MHYCLNSAIPTCKWSLFPLFWICRRVSGCTVMWASKKNPSQNQNFFLSFPVTYFIFYFSSVLSLCFPFGCSPLSLMVKKISNKEKCEEIQTWVLEITVTHLDQFLPFVRSAHGNHLGLSHLAILAPFSDCGKPGCFWQLISSSWFAFFFLSISLLKRCSNIDVWSSRSSEFLCIAGWFFLTLSFFYLCCQSVSGITDKISWYHMPV